MNRKKNLLNRYKAKQEVTLKDLASILDISSAHLSRIERGVKEPSTRLFLLYHILFDEISIPEFFKKQYDHWITEIIQRAEKLMNDLQNEQTSKSDYRLSYLKYIVNRLAELQYETK